MAEEDRDFYGVNLPEFVKNLIAVFRSHGYIVWEESSEFYEPEWMPDQFDDEDDEDGVEMDPGYEGDVPAWIYRFGILPRIQSIEEIYKKVDLDGDAAAFSIEIPEESETSWWGFKGGKITRLV